MNYQMPKITVPDGAISGEDRAIVASIINTRTGELRASKPPVPRKIEVPARSPRYPGDTDFIYANDADALKGCTAYVWRMVAFYVSKNPQHQCMPVTADFDLPYYSFTPEGKALIAQLDKLVNIIVDSIPKQEWAGVIRWGQAYGMIGDPQYNADGTVIYR